MVGLSRGRQGHVGAIAECFFESAVEAASQRLGELFANRGHP